MPHNIMTLPLMVTRVFMYDFRAFPTCEGGEGGRLRVNVPSVDGNDGRRTGKVSVMREREGG